MCAAGYKRHGNGIIAQDADWNGEGRRHLLCCRELGEMLCYLNGEMKEQDMSEGK
jgi:hypothetical protein